MLSTLHTRKLNGQQVDAAMLAHLRAGTNMCLLAPHGASKSQRQQSFADSVTPGMLAGCDAFKRETEARAASGRSPLQGVIQYTIHCGPYDEYKFAGMDMPTTQQFDATVTPESMGVADDFRGQGTIATTSQPVWFNRLLTLGERYPDHVIRIGVEEVNVAPTEMQGQLLELLDSRCVGMWSLPPSLRDRVAFVLLGNLESDNASRWNFTGPLSGRVWTYNLEITVDEVLDYIDEQGDSNPFVYHALKANGKPLLFVPSVLESPDGCVIPGLANDLDVDESGGGVSVPVINGCSPRTWHQVARFLNQCNRDGMPPETALLLASGRMPTPAADVLTVAVELSKRFASIEAIVADPDGAALDEAPLVQSTQIRFMLGGLLTLRPEDVQAVVRYIKRMTPNAQDAFASLVTKRVRQLLIPGAPMEGAAVEVLRKFSQVFSPGLIDSMVGGDGKDSMAYEPSPVVSPAVTAAPAAQQDSFTL